MFSKWTENTYKSEISLEIPWLAVLCLEPQVETEFSGENSMKFY